MILEHAQNVDVNYSKKDLTVHHVLDRIKEVDISGLFRWLGITRRFLKKGPFNLVQAADWSLQVENICIYIFNLVKSPLRIFGSHFARNR